MKSLPKRVSINVAFVSLACVAAACGGTSKGSAPPPGGGGGGAAGPAGPADSDDAATPFDDGAVKAALASSPGVESCGADASTTMGAHFAAQRDALIGGGDGGNAVDESFVCRAQDDSTWECTWSAESGGSGYQIILTLGSDGVIVPDKIYCNAPG